MRKRSVLLPALLCIAVLTTTAFAQSRRGELRGAWMSEGYGRDWPAIMESLHDNGFNAIFPNFSIGSMALYPSRVLTQLPGGDPGRDELAEAAKAARANGIELHVWRIDWALYRAPQDILGKLEAEGRLQRNSKGELGRDDPEVKVDWLCPSDPQNRALEKASMLELVSNYDIAGIQFDYMRFPGADYCFCDGCKERFQKQAGVTVATWPDDVQGDGPFAEKWREWRRGLMTSLVADIGNSAVALKPDIRVSLAAWDDLEDGRQEFGQDWTAWAREGLLDFVCPMDYTPDADHLTEHLVEQIAAIHSAIPLYAGLSLHGLTSSGDLIGEIEAARAAGADGFVTFSYSNRRLVPWLPDLAATVTAGDPGPMPHNGPPASFAFSGEATASPADGTHVLAGARLEAGISVGWEPPAPSDDEEAAAAAQAGALLQRALDVRDPVRDYDQRANLAAPAGGEDRLSGRLLVEGPNGEQRLFLGMFDSAYRFQREIGLAIYGTLKTAAGARDFVVRSPLLTGMERTALAPAAPAPSDALTRLQAFADTACTWPEISLLSSLAPITVQLRANGSAAGEWWLAYREDGCQSGSGVAEKPEVTLTASTEDWLALAGHQITARELYERGRLQIETDDATFQRLTELYGGAD
jgi:uncharacterized lipoprotein YddW (UPF0748 family)